MYDPPNQTKERARAKPRVDWTFMSSRKYRKSAIAVAVSLCVVLIISASCGTLVQVVDAQGAPVSGAQVQLIYPSFSGPSATTDSGGFVRLSDAWLSRPTMGVGQY